MILSTLAINSADAQFCSAITSFPQAAFALTLKTKKPKATNEEIISFFNTFTTPDGGTHVAGFERSLTTALNQALNSADLRKLRKLKDDAKVQKEDAQEGLIAVVRIVFPEPQFRGQTKRELGLSLIHI